MNSKKPKDLYLELSLFIDFYEVIDANDSRVGVYCTYLTPFWELDDWPDDIWIKFSKNPEPNSYEFYWDGPKIIQLVNSTKQLEVLNVPMSFFFYLQNKWDPLQTHISILTKEDF